MVSLKATIGGNNMTRSRNQFLKFVTAIVISAIVLATTTSESRADDIWTDLVEESHTHSPPADVSFFQRNVDPNAQVLVGCGAFDFERGQVGPAVIENPCENASGETRAWNIPLSEFARSDTVEALRDQLHSSQKLINRVAALASVTDTVMPQNGDKNRVAVNVANFKDQTAVGINYVRLVGDFDVSASYARSGSEDLGKVGVGFSW